MVNGWVDQIHEEKKADGRSCIISGQRVMIDQHTQFTLKILGPEIPIDPMLKSWAMGTHGCYESLADPFSPKSARVGGPRPLQKSWIRHNVTMF